MREGKPPPLRDAVHETQPKRHPIEPILTGHLRVVQQSCKKQPNDQRAGLARTSNPQRLLNLTTKKLEVASQVLGPVALCIFTCSEAVRSTGAFHSASSSSSGGGDVLRSPFHHLYHEAHVSIIYWGWIFGHHGFLDMQDMMDIRTSWIPSSWIFHHHGYLDIIDILDIMDIRTSWIFRRHGYLDIMNIKTSFIFRYYG